MQKPPLLSVGSVGITILRKSAGQYVNGFWEEAQDEEEVCMRVSLQPLKYNDLLLLPEQSRTNKTIKGYSRCLVRTAKEGEYEADEFEWDGDRYKVMRVLNYSVGPLQHWKFIAERVEVSL